MRRLGLVLSGLLWAGPAFAETHYVTVRLTHNDLRDSDPEVNASGEVVWIGSTERSAEVFLHDGFETHQLTDNDALDQSAVINDAGRVAWTRDLENAEIFLFENGLVFRLTRDLGDSFLLDDRTPRLNAFGHVTWMKHTAVMYYDRRSRQPVASGAFGSASPVINRRAEIAWAQGSTTAPDVQLYARGVVSRLATAGGAPRINDRGHVVWSGRSGSSRGIFRWDGRSTRLIATGEGISGPPALNGSGQIAWSGFDGEDREVFLYSSSVVRQVTDNDVDDFNPRLNSQGQLVWQQGHGTAAEILLLDGDRVIPLSQGGLNWQPKISDGGHVVWWGRRGPDDSAREIFLALPLEELLDRFFHFYEAEVLEGGLVGAEPDGPARLSAFGERLGQVSSWLDRGLVKRACRSLGWLYTRLDGDPVPPDTIAGTSLGSFRDLFEQVTGALDCVSATRIPAPVSCYEAHSRRQDPAPRKLQVTLLDRFGSEPRAYRVRGARDVCVPADVDGVATQAPEADLTCYRVSPMMRWLDWARLLRAVRKGDRHELAALVNDLRHGRSVSESVVATDAFGEHTLEVRRLRSLCLPSSTRMGSDPVEAEFAGREHFACYEVNTGGHSGPRRGWRKRFVDPNAIEIEITDRFNPAGERRALQRVSNLCVAVDKNGEGIVDSESNLTCHEFSSQKWRTWKNASKAVVSDNQFGPDQELRLGRLHRLCMPADVTPIEPASGLGSGS